MSNTIQVLIKIFNEEATVKPVLEKLSVDLIKFIQHHFKKDDLMLESSRQSEVASRATLVNSLLESIQTKYHYLLKALNGKM